MHTLRTTWTRAIVVALGALTVVSMGASTALAQDGPYGSTTTTTAPPRTATISLTVSSGPRGSEVGVSACGYVPGEGGGSVTFDGQVVASGLVANRNGCLTADGRSTAPLTIRVPNDARSGQRNVCSVRAGYNTPCAKFRVVGGNGNGNGNGNGTGNATANGNGNGQQGGDQVLGATVLRDQAQSALPRTDASASGRSFWPTFIAVILLLIAAALALLLGLRRRRRDAAVTAT